MIKRNIYLIVPIFFLLYTLTGCKELSKETEIHTTENSIEVSTEISTEISTEVSSSDKVGETKPNIEDEPIEYHRLSADEKMEDFDFLFNTLSSNYPFFDMNKRLYAVDWLANKDSYIKQIEDTKGNLEFYMVLNSIIKDLNYGHAQVLNDSAYVYLLKRNKSVMAEPWVEIFEDPVVQSRYSYALEAKDKDSVTEDYIYPDNIALEKWPEISTAYVKINSFNHFNIEGDWKAMQPFLNELDDVNSLIIDIRGNMGGDTAYWSKYLLPELIYEEKESSQYYCFRGGDYSERFVEYKLGYKYADMEVIDQSFYEELSSNIPEEIKIDFRYYLKSTTVIDPIDEEGYRGDIYLLVDHNVFSSAEQFVQFVRDTKLAYIIGEATSGESAGFDSLVLRLPNSGYVIRFPGVMVLSSSGINTNEVIINPDLFGDSKMALEEAIELIKINNE